MMRVLHFCLAACLLTSVPLSAFSEEVTLSMSGTVGVAFRAGDRALTFGGPKISLTADRTSISAAFFPSLLYLDGLEPSLRPTLGFGPEIMHRNFGIIVPFYYVRNRTFPFFGISYKF